MKLLPVFLTVILLLSSCTSDEEIAAEIGDKVVKAFEDNKSISEIIKNLEAIDSENEIDFGFREDAAFKEKLRKLFSSDFSIPLYVNRNATRIDGNIPFILEEGEYEIFISEHYDEPYFSTRLPITYMGEQTEYERLFGNFNLYSERKTFEYKLFYEQLKGLNGASSDAQLNINIPLDKMVDGLGSNRIRDLIVILEKYKSIEFIESIVINDIGDNKANKKDNYSSDNETMDNVDFDEAIREYEDFVTRYVAVIKRVKNNDMSAMAEYTELMEKSESATRKLSSLQGQMTPEQVSKFVELQAKLTKMMTEVAY